MEETTSEQDYAKWPPRLPPARWTWVRYSGWTRLWLGLLLLGMLLVYGLAAWLTPWDAKGAPLRHGVHEQLGLAPCLFMEKTGWLCPTCGMTTSFSHVMHGQWQWAWQAHPLGTMFAVVGWVLVLGLLWAVFRGSGPYLDDVACIAAGMIGLGLIIVVWGVRLLLQ